MPETSDGKLGVADSSSGGGGMEPGVNPAVDVNTAQPSGAHVPLGARPDALLSTGRNSVRVSMRQQAMSRSSKISRSSALVGGRPSMRRCGERELR